MVTYSKHHNENCESSLGCECDDAKAKKLINVMDYTPFDISPLFFIASFSWCIKG